MFSYNTKTGNIMQFDRRIVRWEKQRDDVRFYTLQKKCKCYLSRFENKELAKTVKWLIEEHGCDFGEDVNSVAKFAA